MGSWKDAAGKKKASKSDPAWRLPSRGESIGHNSEKRRGGRLLKGIVSATGAVIALILLYTMTTIVGCESGHLYITSAGAGGSKYASGVFPEIVFGEEDTRTLIQTGESTSRLDVTLTPREVDFSSQYKDLNPSNTLIIYLSVHGSADEDGAILYPDSFNPDDTAGSSPIRAESLWNALEAQPPNQNKLVLLDVTRIPFEGRLGFFENKFLLNLKERAAKIPNLFIISASATGETNWTSPQLGYDGQGGSVFAHFFAKGIQGEADTIKPNGRITVRELYEYLHRKVNAWVKQNRHGWGQHVQMIPDLNGEASDNTFTILSVSGLRKSQPPDEIEIASDLSEVSASTVKSSITRSWEQIDRFRANLKTAPYHVQPLRWRMALSRLMRAEQWLADERPSRAKILADAAEADINALKESGKVSHLVVQSGNEFVTRNLFAYLPDTSSDDIVTGQTAELLPTHVASLIGRSWVPANVLSLRDGLEVIVENVEDASHPALGSFPIVRRQIERAAELRRIAFDRFVIGDEAQTKTAIDMARQSCRQIEQDSSIWQTAELTVNRVHALVPELFRWAANRQSTSNVRTQLVRLLVDALDRSRPIPVDLDKLAALAPANNGSRLNDYDRLEIELFAVSELSQRLQSRLFGIANTGVIEQEAPEQIVNLATDINDRLDSIRRSFEDLAGTVRDSRQPHAELWRELRDLLRVPVLSAETRRGILARQISVSGQLFAGDLEEAAELEQARSLDSIDAVWPALCSIRCIILGEDDPSTLEDLNSKWLNVWIDTTRGETDSIVELGKLVRRAWYSKRKIAIPQLGDRPTMSELRKSLFRADQAARTLHPADAAALASEANPAEQLRRFYLAEQCAADAKRYLEDFWEGWYANAADASLTSATTFFPRLPQSHTEQSHKRSQQLLAVDIQPRVPDVEFGSSKQVEVTATVRVSGDIPRGQLRFRALTNDARANVGTRDEFYPFVFSSQATFLELPVIFVKAAGSDSSLCELPAQPEVYFRGHVWSDSNAAFKVLPCPPKGVRFRYSPAPEVGTVLVDGLDRRPLLFILDGSGSMEEPLKQNAQTRKITAAKDSLYAVLETMAKSNAGRSQKREAAFFAFGHKAVPDRNTGKPTYPPERLKTWPGAEKPALEKVDEALIQRLKNVLLDKSQFNPQGNTMLLAAIRDACVHLRDARQSGLIVAITDGADSLVSANDPRWKPLFTEIKELRQSAANRGTEIGLHLVAFDVTTADSQLLQHLNFGGRDRFFDAPSAEKLAADLQEATDPRPYTVSPVSRATSGSRTTEQLGTPVSQLRRGQYEVHFGAIKPFKLEIRGGELLRYQLDSEKLSWIKLPEVPLATVTASPGTQEMAVTRFTVNLETSQATFHVSLFPKDSSVLFQPYPGEIEFEVSATNDAEAKLPLSWTVLTEQSIPSWKVTVDEWPRRSGAQIQAVWKNERSPFKSVELKQGDAVEIGSLAGRSRSLQLVRVSSTPNLTGVDEAAVTIECRIDPPLLGAIDATVFQHLAGLKLELLNQDGVVDSAVEREVIEEGGVIHATLSYPRGSDSTQYRLGITSWQARLDGASRTSEPLTLASPQNSK